MRWAEVRAAMSTVSSPDEPSMVMVLKLRLVPVKLPITWIVSPPLAPPFWPPGDVTWSVLTRISSTLSSSATIAAAPVPLRVITISVEAASCASVLPATWSQADRL